MELQSLVIGSEEIELSLGKRDGGREYMFVRLPLPEGDFNHRSINDVHLAILSRVRDVVDAQMDRLQALADQADVKLSPLPLAGAGESGINYPPVR